MVVEQGGDEGAKGTLTPAGTDDADRRTALTALLRGFGKFHLAGAAMAFPIEPYADTDGRQHLRQAPYSNAIADGLFGKTRNMGASDKR
jgi:hypothetical protein